MEGEAASRGESILRWSWRIALATLALLTLGVAVFVATADPYTPGSDFGYNLGLVGGLMMLSLLLYPLRKRFRMLERLGAMNTWFRYHMFIGIAGPVLVMFHSTFQLNSMNGAIAFFAMLMVMLSGVIGRFIYRHVHRGLYGRKLTMSTAREDIQTSIARLGSIFALEADVEPKLRAFQEYAFAPSTGFFQGAWRFVTLRSKALAVSSEIRAEIRPAMVRQGLDMKLPKRQIILEYKLAKGQINAFLDAVVMAAQLATWERAFSLWHLVHIPFLYLLVISGIVHVIAVHMY
jgi:hypothetical protein